MVRALREKCTRALGEGLGWAALSCVKSARIFAGDIETIRIAIKKFQQKVVERLEKELADSQRKLVEGLLPAVKKSLPSALTAQVSGKPSSEVTRRYLHDELTRVIPTAQNLVGEMKLECVLKGVTYETLSSSEFQERVRAAFPYENWDKPFREFEAAPSVGGTGNLFD